MTMDAVILAGGFGTRLREVVADVPKPMAPVAGRPFLEILLDVLARQGVGRVTLSTGHLAHVVSNHFGRRYAGMELHYEVESVPLGTGGAIAAALPHCRGDHALVLNGDSFVELDVQALEQRWRGVPMMLARHVDDTSRYGRLHVREGQVVGLLEKGCSGPGLINAGVYVLPLNELAQQPIAPPFSFEVDVLMPRLAMRPYDLVVAEGLFIDIGLPDDYRRAQHLTFPSSAGLS